MQDAARRGRHRASCRIGRVIGETSVCIVEGAGKMIRETQWLPSLRLWWAIFRAQLDPITYVHLASPSREARKINSCGDVCEKLYREAGASTTPIPASTAVPGPRPTTQLHFQLSPPSVHQMPLTLERLGHIRRQPGVARSIEVLLATEDLPVEALEGATIGNTGSHGRAPQEPPARLRRLANDGQDTRALQQYLGHKKIQRTVRYTELAAIASNGRMRLRLLLAVVRAAPCSTIGLSHQHSPAGSYP